MTPQRRTPRRIPSARLLLPAGLLPALVALLLCASPAAAVVQQIAIPGGTTSVGVAPPDFNLGSSTSSSFANNAGNPVMHSSNVFAIYWDPQDLYKGNWQALIDQFLEHVSSDSGRLSNHYALDGQYADRTNGHAAYASTFRGAYTDTDAYPTSGNCTDPNAGTKESPYDFGFVTCITDTQIREELQRFVSQAEPGAPSGLPKGMTTMYLLLTPPGVAVCIGTGGPGGHCSDNPPSSEENGVCSYHSAITSSPATGDPNTLIYGVVPWTAGGFEDYSLPFYESAPKGSQLSDQLGSACQDGNWDASEAVNDVYQEETKLDPSPITEQEPNQLTFPKLPDGMYDEGLADLIINQASVEQQNTVTDPLLDGWQDSAHQELMDECRNVFIPTLGGSVSPQKNTNTGTLYNQSIGEGKYYLNDTFNLAGVKLSYPGGGCGNEGVNLFPAFTAPTSVNTGEVVGFNGQESDVTLDWGTYFSTGGSPQPTYATYTWKFGDGTPDVSGFAPGAPSTGTPQCSAPWDSPCAASTFHSYTYGGVYDVILTVKDVAGDEASISHKVSVVGPLSPGETNGEGAGSGASPGTGGTDTAGGSGTPGNTGSGTTPLTIPAPIAAAAALSSSIAQVVRNGLTVRYSVNEQVAGHFEVLLETKAARRLGIKGRAATGLPQGAAPALVIAQAILVTTKGGHNAVHIKFSKAVASHLRKAKKVTLQLRLIVRNGRTPKSTTVTSTVVLHK